MMQEKTMIHYDEYGSPANPTILLLHGAGATDTFCRQYGFSKKYHLVVPHLQGAGESVTETYHPETQKQALYELIASLGCHKIGMIGHSLGAQLAVMLASEHPELFSYAVFLSAWVNPTPQSVNTYLKLSAMTAKMLHWKGLVRFQAKYWGYTDVQAKYMAEYSRKLTGAQYKAFFSHTLRLDDYPQYPAITLPMLAICGSGEVKDMKASLALLGKNPHCKTLILSKASHDFPMRCSDRLNPVLLDFIGSCR